MPEAIKFVGDVAVQSWAVDQLASPIPRCINFLKESEALSDAETSLHGLDDGVFAQFSPHRSWSSSCLWTILACPPYWHRRCETRLACCWPSHHWPPSTLLILADGLLYNLASEIATPNLVVHVLFRGGFVCDLLKVELDMLILWRDSF